MRSDLESDEFTTVSYEAAAPRRRDFWRVLLGRWQPEVRRVERITIAGLRRELKAAWDVPAMEAQMYVDNPWLAQIEEHQDVQLPEGQ